MSEELTPETVAHVTPVSTEAPPKPAVTLTPEVALTAVASLPTGFRFGAVSGIPVTAAPPAPPAPPSLGPLAAFTGTFTGTGFNTIFRPDDGNTPLPDPVTGDNLLELNLTTETLSFSPALGNVPNRGMVQGDIFLNGVPYLQAVNDVTNGAPIGIHLEPGLWVIVPATTNPAEGVTLARMGSIPHGTTINAPGTFQTSAGAPVIPPVSITPFITAPPHGPITFASQTATAQGTARLPQDLTAFIAAGTITQAILTDPNTVLRNHIAGQTITSTTTISISTSPASPLFGGGTDNIAFLVNNADTALMTATFWIETVEHIINLPISHPGEGPLTLTPEATGPGQLAPKFTGEPPTPITVPRQIKVFSTQIQYSQMVLLNFNGLSWPHVSVATLVPSGAVQIPPGGWGS